MPMLLVELKWGPIWREERRVRLEKEKDERNKAEQRVVSNESVVDNTETGNEMEQEKKLNKT